MTCEHLVVVAQDDEMLELYCGKYRLEKYESVRTFKFLNCVEDQKDLGNCIMLQNRIRRNRNETD